MLLGGLGPPLPMCIVQPRVRCVVALVSPYILHLCSDGGPTSEIAEGIQYTSHRDGVRGEHG